MQRSRDSPDPGQCLGTTVGPWEASPAHAEESTWVQASCAPEVREAEAQQGSL